jgi:hypothetical protein
VSSVLIGTLIFAVIVVLLGASFWMAERKGRAGADLARLERVQARRRKVDEILASGQRSRTAVVDWLRARGRG